MMNLLNHMTIAAYLSVAGFFQDLKKDERGLSGVVVAVLLILVAVLAVVLLWGLLGDWLQNTLWPQITGAASSGLTPR